MNINSIWLMNIDSIRLMNINLIYINFQTNRFVGILRSFLQNFDSDELSQHIQCSPFITLYLGSIGMDHVISVPCYKGSIL